MRPIDRLNFYNDARTQARYRRERVKVRAEGDTALEVEVDLGETTERFVLPLVYAVCDLCQGRGKCVDPEIDAGGLTSADFDENPDLRTAYFGGRYDITCPECRGRRVTVDNDAVLASLPESTRAELAELQRDDEAFLREQMAELAFGC